MNKPRLEADMGSYRYIWDEYQLTVTATRVTSHRDGRTTAELLFESTAPGVPHHLHGPVQLNLTSTQSRKGIETALASRYPALPKEDWAAILEAVCAYTIRAFRTGEPVVTLSTENPLVVPQWALHPLIPKDLPTLIYGKGGSGKSILAMSWLICLETDWQDNHWGLQPWEGGMHGIYFDWELDRNDNEGRLQSIGRGHNLGKVEVRYRRCAVPLADDLEPIRQIICEDAADFIVIDSVFGAAGGDLNATDVASRFFTALRRLPVTSLLVAHPNKNGETDGPLGSVMYVNQVRSMWEVNKVQDVGTDEIEVGLFHKKANTTKLQKPMGYRISFEENAIRIRQSNPADNETLAEKVPLRLRIIGLLRQGAKSNKDLVDLMPDAKANSILQTTGRMAKAGELVSLAGQRYGLAERHHVTSVSDNHDNVSVTNDMTTPPYKGGVSHSLSQESQTNGKGSPLGGKKPEDPF